MDAQQPPDPDRIAEVVSGLDQVVRLHGGVFGEVATYLPGRRVVGIQVGEERIEIHVVGRLGTSLPELAEQVRSAVLELAPGYPIDVVVDDVAESDDVGAKAVSDG